MASQQLKKYYEEKVKEPFVIRGLHIKPIPEHEDQDWLVDEMNAFTDKMGLKRADRSQLSIVGYCMPNLKDRNLLRAITIRCVVAQSVDDLAEDSALKLDKVSEMIESSGLTTGNDNKLEELFKSVVEAFKDYLDGDKLMKFYNTHLAYVSSMANNELHDKFNNDSVLENKFSMPEFWEIRRRDFGADADLFLCELVTNSDFTQIQHDEFLVGKLNRYNDCFIKTMILANELFSWKKEVSENKYRCNYLFLKMVSENKDIQQIVDIVVKELKEEMNELKSLGSELVQLNDIFKEYVRHILKSIEGFIYFYSISKRYHQI